MSQPLLLHRGQNNAVCGSGGYLHENRWRASPCSCTEGKTMQYAGLEAICMRTDGELLCPPTLLSSCAWQQLRCSDGGRDASQAGDLRSATPIL